MSRAYLKYRVDLRPKSRPQSLGVITALFLSFLAQGLFAQDQGFNAEAGLIDSFQTQFPAKLWQDQTADQAAKEIRSSKAATSPEINHLRLMLILSRSEPALSKERSEHLAAERLNYLLKIGALDQAEALLNEFSWKNKAIQRNVEVTSLLTTRPEKYCNALLSGEFEELHQGFRIYCLTRADRWNDATEEFERIKDGLDEGRKAALERFLDLDGGVSPERDQAWEKLPDPLTFVLDEAIGRPRGKDKLPPSYQYFSRETGVTPRNDLEATEALVRLGASPPPLLFAAYRANKSAESGGSWGRAEIVQRLDQLDPENIDNIGKLLYGAIERFSEAGLLTLFAKEAASHLSAIDMAQISDKTAQRNFIRLGLLGGWSQASWQNILPKGDGSIELAFFLRHGELLENNAEDIKTPSPETRIIHSAFFDGLKLPNMSGSTGEQIWKALNILDEVNAHPEYLAAEALQILILNGQDAAARNIALSILLEDRK